MRFLRHGAQFGLMGFSTFVSLLASGPVANAYDYGIQSFVIYEPYVSPRALGMGNAFCGLADDEYAIFFNPAGLARLEEGKVNLGVGIGVDSKVQQLKNDISSNSGSGSQSLTQEAQLLQANYGNHYSLRGPTVDVMWARPHWGFAFVPADLSLEMEIHQLAGAALNVLGIETSTMAYGRGWDANWVGRGRLSFGITGKAIYRGYYDTTLLASDLAFNSNILQANDADEGFTIDADVGTLWSPYIDPKSWWHLLEPTFGATVHNVGNYGYLGNFHLIGNNTGTPPPLGRELDVGSSLHMPDWWIFKTHFVADLRDIGDPNWTLQKGYHLGYELLWKVRSWWQGGWRVGVSQGYFTAGFTGRLLIFNLDLVTYAEEVGPANAPKADRIYMAKASMAF